MLYMYTNTHTHTHTHRSHIDDDRVMGEILKKYCRLMKECCFHVEEGYSKQFTGKDRAVILKWEPCLNSKATGQANDK